MVEKTVMAGTPSSIPKVCRECFHDHWCYPKDPAKLRVPQCAALELLQTISAQSPSDCRSEEMCLLAERLRKEVT